MKTFDCHSDMWVSITQKRSRSADHVINNFHRPQLQQGDIQAMICCTWIDPPYTEQPLSRMLEILGAVSEEFHEQQDYVELAYCTADIERINSQNKLALLWGMEGLSGLNGTVSFLDALYRMGVRHAMLTWNEENEFATGVGSPNTDRGLTAKGIAAVKKMEALGMLVDVSHANEKSFWDIYSNTTKPFIASHSNAYALCPHKRNLKDEQIKALAERGGVMGMNAWSEFIDVAHPTAEALANHVDYIANLVGIDHIACGFDFSDYLESDALSFTDAVATTEGISTAADTPNFLNILRKKGYSEADLEKIAYKNILRVLAEVLR